LKMPKLENGKVNLQSVRITYTRDRLFNAGVHPFRLLYRKVKNVS